MSIYVRSKLASINTIFITECTDTLSFHHHNLNHSSNPSKDAVVSMYTKTFEKLLGFDQSWQVVGYSNALYFSVVLARKSRVET